MVVVEIWPGQVVVQGVESHYRDHAALSKTRPKRGCEGFLVVFRATFNGPYSGLLHIMGMGNKTENGSVYEPWDRGLNKFENGA